MDSLCAGGRQRVGTTSTATLVQLYRSLTEAGARYRCATVNGSTPGDWTG